MSAYARSIRPRPLPEVVEALDFYYCLHWHSRNIGEQLANGSVASRSVIVERRRALEWATHRVSWDNISLDT